MAQSVVTGRASQSAARPPAGVDNRRSRRRKDRAWGVLFASPYLAHLLLLMLWPLGASLYFAFTTYDLVNPPEWTGFENFTRLLSDNNFWRTLGNTAYFAVLFVPAQTILALLLAVALNQKIKGIALFRTAFFVPVVSSWVVVAYVADSMLNPRSGIANTLLDWVGLPTQDWLQSPALVIPTLAGVAVWKGVGYMMLLFLAGLQAIPEERYEAAKVDGASALQRLRHITMPGVSGTTFLVLVLTLITTLQAFEQVFVMTDGGPNGASELTVLYMYRQGFEYFQMGYASAIAWVLFLLILVLTIVQLRLQRKWVHYA
ncbi:carbohydrate ABC transporter permease [Phytoactinopolyspora halotolerans]|uniref:Sugar ABC transporter permease n=1 Tax=Phytoactinopolyspora halotolerans TaxID=1981512 RepID=A0A6L9SCJ7_9ACTN|nr:sugar ABC transporter permease [Phytoactinopolyspora halotolerans]NEE02739.1 sugar ABC transporter permease [Phytoactinopolyspora halotolerans]